MKNDRFWWTVRIAKLFLTWGSVGQDGSDELLLLGRLLVGIWLKNWALLMNWMSDQKFLDFDHFFWGPTMVIWVSNWRPLFGIKCQGAVVFFLRRNLLTVFFYEGISCCLLVSRMGARFRGRRLVTGSLTEWGLGWWGKGVWCRANRRIQRNPWPK